MDIDGEIQNLRFNALRNAHYHKARQRYLDFINRGFNFIVILVGTGVVASALTQAGIATWLGILTAVIASSQLVYNPGGRARDHEYLQRRFYGVLAEIEANISPDKTFVAQRKSELVKIYADEPPTMRGLDAIAYNETAASIVQDLSESLQIRWWHSLLRHLHPFHTTTFITIGEVRRQKKKASLLKMVQRRMNKRKRAHWFSCR